MAPYPHSAHINGRYKLAPQGHTDRAGCDELYPISSVVSVARIQELVERTQQVEAVVQNQIEITGQGTLIQDAKANQRTR
eukprot:3062134-Amphidinium_carterae.4